MYIEISILAAGVAPGYILRGNKGAHALTGRLTLWSIHALLFFLGARLGADQALFSSLDRLGAAGLAFAVCTALGSAALVCLAQRFFREKGPGPKAEASGVSETGLGARKLAKAMQGSLVIIVFFALGLFCGRLSLLPAALRHGDMTAWMLWAMLFCVGAGIGFDLKSLLIVRDMGLRVLCIPILGIIGSLAGAALAWAILALSSPDGPALAQSMVVGVTMCYYSLGSVLVTEMGDPALGSVVLLGNLMRELFSLAATPLMARTLGPLAPVAASGAAAMDTCLPIITRSAGERYAILAVFNGLAMTILVPFMIPLAMSFVR